ncbi:hypothetical protein B0H11DRAFT_115506 [Mycena galericulata]|nr:hypothetical protein B0H11DRAFT_115506 [Mycena galericulata]
MRSSNPAKTKTLTKRKRKRKVKRKTRARRPRLHKKKRRRRCAGGGSLAGRDRSRGRRRLPRLRLLGLHAAGLRRRRSPHGPGARARRICASRVWAGAVGRRSGTRRGGGRGGGRFGGRLGARQAPAGTSRRRSVGTNGPHGAGEARRGVPRDGVRSPFIFLFLNRRDRTYTYYVYTRMDTDSPHTLLLYLLYFSSLLSLLCLPRPVCMYGRLDGHGRRSWGLEISGDNFDDAGWADRFFASRVSQEDTNFSGC